MPSSRLQGLVYTAAQPKRGALVKALRTWLRRWVDSARGGDFLGPFVGGGCDGVADWGGGVADRGEGCWGGGPPNLQIMKTYFSPWRSLKMIKSDGNHEI